jgi:hypothetical protein
MLRQALVEVFRPVLDLPRVRWSVGAVAADVVAAQAGCMVSFAVLPPFLTVVCDS